MNVCYSTDENYAIHTCVSIYSLLLNNKTIKNISIYIIENRLSEITKSKIKKIVNQFIEIGYERKLIFLNFLLYESFIKDAKPCGSLSTYGRLFLQDYLKDIDKIIYIDCDTVVLNNIETLFDIQMDGFAVAGVQDICSFINRKPLGLNENDRYINAGVQLINLKYWRENDGMKKCLDFIRKFDGKVPFEDQGTINGVFVNKIKIIHPKYNFMNHMLRFNANKISLIYNIKNYYSNKEIKEANSKPCIVHFTAGFYLRPWFSNSNHPYRKAYKKYRKYLFDDIGTFKKNKKPIKTVEKIKHSLYLILPYFILKLFYKTKRQENVL